MFLSVRTFVFTFSVVLLASVFATPSQAQIKRLKVKDPFPICTNQKVLKKIVERFNWAERKTWHRGFEMIEVHRAHTHHNHGFQDSPIHRRYCHGHAHMSNGKSYRLYYLIEENMGFAGFGWGVSFCLTALEPWRVYDGKCRVLREYH